jgi:hypothetical protein
MTQLTKLTLRLAAAKATQENLVDPDVISANATYIDGLAAQIAEIEAEEYARMDKEIRALPAGSTASDEAEVVKRYPQRCKDRWLAEEEEHQRGDRGYGHDGWRGCDIDERPAAVGWCRCWEDLEAPAAAMVREQDAEATAVVMAWHAEGEAPEDDTWILEANGVEATRGTVEHGVEWAERRYGVRIAEIEFRLFPCGQGSGCWGYPDAATVTESRQRLIPWRSAPQARPEELDAPVDDLHGLRDGVAELLGICE